MLAVPDPRTSSLIVMASKTLMPQIADMIAELDADKGRKEVVGFYDLQNADPQDVYNNLQDLFQRNNVRQQNNNQNTHAGTEQPAQPARTQQCESTSATTTSRAGAGRAVRASRRRRRRRLLALSTSDQRNLDKQSARQI